MSTKRIKDMNNRELMDLAKTKSNDFQEQQRIYKRLCQQRADAKKNTSLWGYK